MIKYTFVLSLLLTQVVFAKEIITYSVADQVIVFKRVENLLVNKSCEDKKCTAYKAGKTLNTHRPTPGDLVGGKNPLSVICKKNLSGKVLIGQDLRGNSQSICYFKDQSYLILK